MPGDYSRFTDNPNKNFVEVLMQQGKVQLDSDWNEMVELLTRADRLRALDTFGPAAVPRDDDNSSAFQITNVGTDDFTFGLGRMYVDGILVEALPSTPPENTYKTQPFFVTPPGPPKFTLATGDNLVYLDVWKREITFVENPDLLDSALGGVDTATRMQTVWQVKVEPNLNCASNLTDKFKPTDGTMTVQLNLPPNDPDPCKLPETGGFFDVENRHYRVELHQRTAGGPFFVKFARDPVVGEVTKIELNTPNPNQTRITLKSLGRDAVLRFSKDDCIEFLTERHVLNGEPGVIGTIVDIDKTLPVITIDQLLTAGDDAAALRPRVIRWDQRTGNAEPLIPLVFAPNVIPLEAGIEVVFKGTTFHHGDYWMFPARAAARTAGPLTDAPPRGTEHHYAPLATVTVGTETTIDDCRTLWPPETDCECAACVNPEDHKFGRFTIQNAIDKVTALGGGKICLHPGTYILPATVKISGASSIRLTGHGTTTLIHTGTEDTSLLVDSSTEIVLENFRLFRSGSENANAIVLRDVFDVAVEHCVVSLFVTNLNSGHEAAPGTARMSYFSTRYVGIAVALDGLVQRVRVHEDQLFAAFGIARFPNQPEANLLVNDLLVQNCAIVAASTGVDLAPDAGMAVTLRGNRIDGSGSGIRLHGPVAPGFANTITENEIHVDGTGVEIGTDETTVANNAIVGRLPDAVPQQPPNPAASGIWVRGNRGDVVDDLQIIGNRIANMWGSGIYVDVQLNAMIKQNVINRAAGGGIVLLDANAESSQVSIANNAVIDSGLGFEDGLVAGIQLPASCRGGVIDNEIVGVGIAPDPKRPNAHFAGIFARVPDDLRIQGNRVQNVLPGLVTSSFSAGIDVEGPVGKNLMIENNSVKVDVPTAGQLHCYTLRILRPRQLFWTYVRLNEQAVFPGGQAYVIGTWHVTAVALSSMLVIRGNSLEFNGGSLKDVREPMVTIDDEVSFCTFGGNICLAPGGNRPFGVFLVTVGTAVVDSNQIIGVTQDGGVGLSIGTISKRATVTGNLVTGQIQLEGSPLGAPWNAINIAL